MSRAHQLYGLGVVLALLAGLVYGALKLTTSRAPACQVCGRGVHKDMRTLAFVGDRRGVFCCPTCALSEGAQLHKTVRFAQLSDFATGNPLRPADAIAVWGSDVVPCVHSHEILDQDRQPVPAAFDRCSPSMIAFATHAAAERFAAQHGGRVETFLHLIEQPAFSPSR